MTAIADIQKKRGRPPTGRTAVLVKMLPEQLARLDAWIEDQDAAISRPEAVRQLVEKALP